MLNLWQIGAHFLWILGLAILLATFSLAHYEARQVQNQPLSLMNQPGSRRAIFAGFFLFFIGLTILETNPIQQLAWGFVTLLLLISLLWRK